MEKLHKYCLSVLLVLVCSNISAHTNNESIKNIDCKQFYEIYSQFLKYEFENPKEFYLKEKSTRSFTINHKRNAVDLFGNAISEKRHNNSYSKKSESDFSSKEKHHKILKNFEKQTLQNDFAENIYFKSKVAKIRNKDDLDLKNKT
ncbi:hypothetical protein CHRY9390_01653 [Chryseobacterium aquaeductus]|uniref:Uncharacterized protein n=1 Tax=Chryseobacterium aquaeductus TaxID=2675056 RepID=A0A9N8QSG1_9FLAO|nr:hypothetical protein [Chryseobacterium aquaeductus]CAA7330974.1 hypothetical protein CHRY9390_01653 [Chryseobacterium potabilaquae]CAD7807410.1 hypothetical protein CHRY9390_01653 [Chryseobacterium aquaeductus]